LIKVKELPQTSHELPGKGRERSRETETERERCTHLAALSGFHTGATWSSSWDPFFVWFSMHVLVSRWISSTQELRSSADLKTTGERRQVWGIGSQRRGDETERAGEREGGRAKVKGKGDRLHPNIKRFLWGFDSHRRLRVFINSCDTTLR
jgi:hypothetical protein